MTESSVTMVDVMTMPDKAPADEPRADAGADAGALTIDELARRVGMTVRNLREWRALGLLPPAELRGRVGYYAPAVVERIEGIKSLHAQGFPLELIRRMLDAGGDAAADALDLVHALRSTFRDPAAPVVDLADLARTWGEIAPDALRRAIELGLLRERPDGHLEFTSARVARVGEALHRLGLSLDETLEATAEIRAHTDALAKLFERRWRRHVWDPFVEAGFPVEQAADVERALREMPPLALDAVIGIFTVAMEARIDAGIAQELERAERGGVPAPEA